MNESTPLILTFDDGKQVSVTDAKSVVGARHQDRYSHCAIVRGQQGAAFCQPSEDVLVNGAPSSVHWLQPGDQIQFGDSATATVEQLGRLNDSISELKQAFAPATPAVDLPAVERPSPTSPEPTPIANDPAAVETPETQPTVTPESLVVSPVAVEPNAPEVAEPTATQEPLSDFAAQLLQSISDESPTDTYEATDQPAETIAGFDASETGSNESTNSTFTLVDTPAEDISVETPVASAPEVIAPEPQVVAPEPQVNDSVSAILERMKSEGDWDGAPEEEVTQPEAPIQQVAAVETPPASEPKVECDDDVESYMSQLLTRMRGGEPDAEQPVEQEVTPEPTAEETTAPVEPAQVNPLKPEEFVPKTKARRADTWQQMRDLSNFSSQAAITSSDAKKKQQSLGSLQTTIGICCAIAAFCIWATSLLGPLSASIAIAIVISAGFILYKTFVLDGPRKKVVVTVKPIPAAANETAEA